MHLAPLTGIETRSTHCCSWNYQPNSRSPRHTKKHSRKSIVPPDHELPTMLFIHQPPLFFYFNIAFHTPALLYYPFVASIFSKYQSSPYEPVYGTCGTKLQYYLYLQPHHTGNLKYDALPHDPLSHKSDRYTNLFPFPPSGQCNALALYSPY